MTDHDAISGQSEINASVGRSFESVGRTLGVLMEIDENQRASIQDLYARIGRLHLWLTAVLIIQVLLAVGLVLT